MRWALGLVVCVLPACGASGSVGSPRDALTRFAQAAEGGDAVALHAMLPTRVRRAQSVDALRARLGEDRVEVQALGRAVREALTQRRLARAEVALRATGVVSVEEDADGWRVSDPGVSIAAATSLDGIAGARASLRALHVLLRRHGAGAWTRVLSSRALGNVSADVAALIEGTEDPASLEYTSSQSTIRFRLPDGRFVVTVYEAGAWRVDRVDDGE